MATETVAAEHTSAIDEQVEKQENEEAIGQKGVPLSSENEDKHDKAEDAQGPTPAIPLSTAEGEDSKAGPAVVEVENTNDSAEDNLKDDKAEEAQDPVIPLSKTEEHNKADHAVVEVEKTDDSPSLEASVAEEEEKELIPESQAISVAETAPDADKSQPEEPLPTALCVEETPPRPEMESAETGEEKQPKTTDIPEAETIEKSSNLVEVDPLTESESEAVKAAENTETSSQPEKKSQQKELEEQPNTDAAPKPSVETIKKPSDAIEETTRDTEFNAAVMKETGSYKAGPTETGKPEYVVTRVEENSVETEKQLFEKETVIHQTSAESTEKPGDIVDVHPPKESDIEIVEKIGNLEAILVSTDVKKKPKEHLEVTEEVKEISKDVKTQQVLVGEFAKSEGTSDDIKDPISSKKEKTDEEEKTSVTESTAQVSFNKKAQVANEVKSSPGITEKVVEEDAKKESSYIDVIEGVSKDVVGTLENSERVSINQETKTDLQEEKEEKVAANDDKKEPGAHVVVGGEGLSREAEVEIKKAEEKNEAETATTEEGRFKLESVTDDRPAVDSQKEGHAQTEVDEIAIAASEPVTETLASKLKEEEESITTGVINLEKEKVEDQVKTDIQIPEPPTKGNEATKTSKDLPKETPAMPSQKQSNNIISKVKQSLVKAKKAITGKSPTSKTLSETKGDIQVK